MQTTNEALEPQSTDTPQDTIANDTAQSHSAPNAPQPGAPDVGTPTGGTPAMQEGSDEAPNQASPVIAEGEGSVDVPQDRRLESEVREDAVNDAEPTQASPVDEPAGDNASMQDSAPESAPQTATTDAPAAPQAAEGKKSLADWWSGLGPEVKDFADLKANGSLVLKAAAGQPERTIATLSQDGKEATLKAVLDKHAEVKERVEKLRAEWDAATDKGKLGGRVQGLREYLKNAPSLGNYEELFGMLDPMEGELSRHAEASHAARLALVEEAERLAESSDWKAATNALRDMTERWKASPPLDKNQADELWGRLEKARDTFFERKRLANEELDKELMNNLDKKLELVDKAEAFAASEDWRKTTEALKGLMDEWKSVGRAAGGRDEELWARFSAAKTVFFDRKKGHFDTIQKEQEGNLEKKMALLEKAEAIQESTDWNKTSAEFEAILQEWRRVGKVPMEKADEIRDRLERAKDTFFGARRAHFETVKVSLTDNYAQKLALLSRAESLKHSTQWREATGEFAELMEEWKRVGPVPREHSRKMWQDFTAARSFFFDRKDSDREKRNERFHQQTVARVDSQRGFLLKLEAEMKEEQENLADFRTSLENVSGPKAKELREHLSKLIAQSEDRIGKKEAKLEQVRREVESIKDPAPATDRNRGGRERGREDRGREGGDRDGNRENRDYAAREPKAEERGQEFSPEVPAGMPVEQAADATTFEATADAVEEGNPSEASSAPGGGDTAGAGASEDFSAREKPVDNASPDAVKDATDSLAANTSDMSATAANTDVITPSAAEQNMAAAQSGGPDAAPADETSTLPMQTGEDSGAIDDASATVD